MIILRHYCCRTIAYSVAFVAGRAVDRGRARGGGGERVSLLLIIKFKRRVFWKARKNLIIVNIPNKRVRFFPPKKGVRV